MKKIILLLLVSVATISFSQAQTTAERNKKEFNLSGDGLGLKGYDPVSYFTSKGATEGQSSINLKVDGVTYRFSSVQNRELFKANPAKYLPQYGGWCAYAMGATGEKVDIDPGTFKITGGKLFLFYNRFFNNTKKTWDKDEANLKAKADANWAKIYH